MRSLKRVGRKCLDVLRNIIRARSSPGMDKELARRNGERGGDNYRWFTPEEAAVAEALARVIVPSDEEAPGIAEIDVLGPPAAVALDGLVATSLDRQRLYARGLYAFDLWARKKHRCRFAELREDDQTRLFLAAQQINENLAVRGSPIARAWRMVRSALLAGNGSFFASRLYPQIRKDCLQIFYTSRVSWVWLEYDGPPMDKGYPSLVEPR